MTEDRPPIADLLREARHRAGLTLAALADRTGLLSSRISDIEHGRKPTYPAALDALTEALGMDRDEAYIAAREVPPEIIDALSTNLPALRRLRHEPGL